MENFKLDSASDAVIACTLTPGDLADRQQAWLRLRRFLVSSQTIPGGLELTFTRAPGLPQSLAELVRLEAACCAWMMFAIEESPGQVGLSITAAGDDGERGVRESFAPLARAAASS